MPKVIREFTIHKGVVLSNDDFKMVSELMKDTSLSFSPLIRFLIRKEYKVFKKI